MFLVDKKPNIVLTLLIIIAAAAGALFFGVMPLLQKIGNLQADIHRSELQLAHIEEQIQSYQTAIVELRKIETNKEEILGLFPPREEMTSLVVGLEGASSRAGGVSTLTIVDRKEASLPQGAKSDAKPVPSLIAGLQEIEEIPYSLKLAGDYQTMIDFLFYLEHRQYITQIKRISITTDSLQDTLTQTVRNTGLANAELEGAFFISQSTR